MVINIKVQEKKDDESFARHWNLVFQLKYVNWNNQLNK